MKLKNQETFKNQFKKNLYNKEKFNIQLIQKNTIFFNKKKRVKPKLYLSNHQILKIIINREIFCKK